jgi:hypothetical protein
MILMSRFRRPQGLRIGPKLSVKLLAQLPGRMPAMLLALLLAMSLALFFTAGCARPAGPQSDGATVHAEPHPVPFHNGEGTTPRHDSHTTQEIGSNPETGPPFHDPANLPVGTLLTVRLKTPISAENPGAHGTFEALVDEPVVIEGNKLIPRGATVAGRVESARVSNIKRNRGFVRLALDSIRLAGLSLPIQTSSLFVRGSTGSVRTAPNEVAPGETPPVEAPPVLIRLEKGRRLTFRLTEPAYVAASQRTPVDR